MAAAFGSRGVIPPPLETKPIPGLKEMVKVANAKVKAWRTAARKGRGKDTALGPMFGATLGEDTFEIPYGEPDTSASPIRQRGNLTGCPKNLRLQRSRRGLGAWSENPLPGGWLGNLHA